MLLENCQSGLPRISFRKDRVVHEEFWKSHWRVKACWVEHALTYWKTSFSSKSQISTTISEHQAWGKFWLFSIANLLDTVSNFHSTYDSMTKPASFKVFLQHTTDKTVKFWAMCFAERLVKELEHHYKPRLKQIDLGCAI